jgi:hypothetical protein
MNNLHLVAISILIMGSASFSQNERDEKQDKQFQAQVKEVRVALDATNDITGAVDKDRYFKIGESIECLEVSRDYGSRAWREERAVVLELFITLLNKIDDRINRNFNFNDMPSSVVSPPDETGLPAGVDPTEIKDATMRAKYEEAIRANTKRKVEYQWQVVLRDADRLWTERAGAFAVKAYIADKNSDYKPPTTDKEELVAALKKRVTNADRRKSLLEFIDSKYKEAQTNNDVGPK